ncbi:unnamed protein product [Cyclocybe aegerita]|uniref:Uncharacterized protein n=1 Tax=Cyclocybe aegerita TaxID=1973307 RepID=A0A8S0XNP3_CYCAE|nr:unnamed protein product [Cyclocybe aegerita]
MDLLIDTYSNCSNDIEVLIYASDTGCLPAHSPAKTSYDPSRYVSLMNPCLWIYASIVSSTMLRRQAFSRVVTSGGWLRGRPRRWAGQTVKEGYDVEEENRSYRCYVNPGTCRPILRGHEESCTQKGMADEIDVALTKIRMRRHTSIEQLVVSLVEHSELDVIPKLVIHETRTRCHRLPPSLTLCIGLIAPRYARPRSPAAPVAAAVTHSLNEADLVSLPTGDSE